MQIQISGQNITITPEIRELTQEKFDRVIKHADRITNVKVNFIVDKLQHIVEAVVHLPGSEIHAKSETDHLEKSLHDLVEKLLRQITRYKEKQQEHR